MPAARTQDRPVRGGRSRRVDWITVDVPRDMFKALLPYAAQEERTGAAQVRVILSEWLRGRA